MIHHQDASVTLHHGDCLDVLRTLPDASVDSVVTDPPYGLEFMGKDWDAPWKASSVGRGARVATERAAEMTETGKGHSTSGGPYLAARVDSVRVAGLPFQQWCELWAAECLRVLKPGGHLLAFGGTRTWHRLACAVEDAGFEVRDSIAWLYGSGFPKSLDVSKAIDKAAGAEREVVGIRRVAVDQWTAAGREAYARGESASEVDVTAPATPDAEQWQGWGTALKPAFEPVVVARKPLIGTVAANVTTHGTGALNIDACRIEGEVPSVPNPILRGDSGHYGSSAGRVGVMSSAPGGRWPANVILDEDMAGVLDQQSGNRPGRASQNVFSTKPKFEAGVNLSGSMAQQTGYVEGYNDTGGASRFFYVAKAPKRERPVVDGVAHPTVKPLALMRWLVRLVTPPGGTVLEPFAGSGTTVEACLLEGFQCIAIEKGYEYLPLILARIHRQAEPVPELDEIVRTIDPEQETTEQTWLDAPLFDLDGEATA